MLPLTFPRTMSMKYLKIIMYKYTILYKIQNQVKILYPSPLVEKCLSVCDPLA